MARAETTVFVPNGDSRKNTAILLVGTADEFGIDQRSILAARSGFWITEALAQALKADYDEPAKPKRSAKQPAKKTSGNRAAKKNSKEE